MTQGPNSCLLVFAHLLRELSQNEENHLFSKYLVNNICADSGDTLVTKTDMVIALLE
jgi:hypothetical protein